MKTPEYSSYEGREQSLIKHQVLDKYLERFSRIVGKGFPGILYIDGFCGPWNVQSERLSDSSFAIALNQLRSARDTVRKVHGKDLEIRCIFLEKNPVAYKKLEEFSKTQADVQIIPINASFEESIDDIVRLAQSAGRGFFPFIFIDPTGWKGFSMNLISPLLQLQPCEVLINFMTGFIIRFIEDSREGLEASFKRLFGDDSHKTKIIGLRGQAREDAIVFAYAKRIGDVGGFAHVPVTVVPHPTVDRAHFHLVYATRRIEGLQVFKDAEKHAVNLSGKVRGDAQKRKREQKSGQIEMFGGEELPAENYITTLHAHYCALAKAEVYQYLSVTEVALYDDVYAIAMKYPLVQIPDLRVWINEVATVKGLAERERFPKLGRKHMIVTKNS